MKHPSHCVHFCGFQGNLIFTEKNFEMINFCQYLYLSVRSFTSLPVGAVCFPVAAKLPQTKKYGVYVWSSSQSCCISFPIKHINLHVLLQEWMTSEKLWKGYLNANHKWTRLKSLNSNFCFHSNYVIAMSPWGSARWKSAAESGDSWKHCR